MIALLSSVFVAAVLGSLHCVGMCGPFATLATARTDRVRLPQVSAASCSGAYNGGRLLAYAVLGIVAGGFGSFVDASGALLGFTRLATALAGGTMIVVGLAGLLRAVGARVPGARAPMTIPGLSRATAAVATLPPHRRAAALGALTSLMPCGWLWAFVLTAAGVASPVLGAAVMAAFWAGTVPAMGLLGAGVHTLSRRLRRHLPWLMPALVTGVGVYTLWIRAPLPLPAPPPSTEETTEETTAPTNLHGEVPRTEDAPCH
ncbi:MAG: sulfite exporter TauE/SafE family protein [Myxococcota bacterium]